MTEKHIVVDYREQQYKVDKVTTAGATEDRGGQNLDYLADVDITTANLSNDSVLGYNTSTGKWEEKEVSCANGITIQDEGVNILTASTTLNFIGETVSVKQGSSTRVDIYIPAPDYVSYFNATGGSTNAKVSLVTTFIRYVAAPTSEGVPYKLGTWSAGSSQSCIRTGIVTYSTSETFSFVGTSSVFTAYIFSALTSTYTNVSFMVTGNTTVSSSGITVQISDWATDFNKYKGNVKVTYNLTAVLSEGGRFSIQLIHADGADGTYTFSQNDLFYDTNENTATVTSISVSETVGQVQTQQVSGIYFYNISSQFTVNVNDIDYLNDRSFPLYQVQIIGSEFGLSSITLQGSQLTGWNNLWNGINDSYAKTDWKINTTDYCDILTASKVQVMTIDWSTSDTLDSNTQKICVCTYTANTSGIIEDFKLESLRLESDFSTSWDSTQSLTAYDTGNGLQFLESRLVYPTIDFTSYKPQTSSQSDYSSLSGDRTFYRRFWHTDTSHSNGYFEFEDYNITETDITNEDILIELSLDNLTWMKLNTLYTGGVISNGGGCRINKDSHSLTIDDRIDFTFGENAFTTAFTGGGWGVYIKITYKSTQITKYIGKISLSNWV